MNFASFGNLLEESWNFCFRSHQKPIVLGIAFFSITFAFAVGITSHVAQNALETMLLKEFGLNIVHLEELTARVGTGDMYAENELEQLVGSSLQQLQGSSDAELAALMQTSLQEFTVQHQWSVLLGSMVLALIFLSYKLYFFTIAATGKRRVREVLQRMIRICIPIVLLSIWIPLRSFVWISLFALLPGIPKIAAQICIIIGIICYCLYLPRFLFAPFILVREKKNILESAEVSFQRTRGYWFAIVWQVALIVIGITLIASSVGLLISSLTTVLFTHSVGLGLHIGHMLSAGIHTIISTTLMVFSYVFFAKLHEAIALRR